MRPMHIASFNANQNISWEPCTRCNRLRLSAWAASHAFMWLWVKANGTTFGVGGPPILVDFSGDSNVHWGTGFWPMASMAMSLIKSGRDSHEFAC